MPKSTKTSRKHKSIKRRFHALKNHPFVIPVVTFLILFFVAMAGYISLGGETLGASDTVVVNLNISGKEQVLPTRARDVKDLLRRLDIKLEEKDIVEPSLNTPIDHDNIKVNIYRARPVLVEDGAKKTVTYTAEPVPGKIAAAAGVQVNPEDKILTAAADTVSATDLVREGIIAERIVIDRATPVFLNLYGTSVPVRTHAKTVAELLSEKNIVLGEGDTLQPDASSKLAPNSQVFVIRIGKTVVSEEQVIPAPVEVVEDPNLPVGTQRVQQAGADGRKVTTYELEVKNGQESARRVIQEIIAAEAVKKIVIKGTKVIISDPSANVVLGQRIAEQMGWGSQFSCIYQIFQRESKWNHLARNRSTGAYGIPQALPGSKMGPGWDTDPAVQIRWGIGYMVSRYGSPCRANSFWLVNHWY